MGFRFWILSIPTLLLCLGVGSCSAAYRQFDFPLVALPPSVVDNQFCNEDYISAPGETMVIDKCPKIIDCDASVLWEIDRKLCTEKM